MHIPALFRLQGVYKYLILIFPIFSWYLKWNFRFFCLDKVTFVWFHKPTNSMNGIKCFICACAKLHIFEKRSTLQFPDTCPIFLIFPDDVEPPAIFWFYQLILMVDTLWNVNHGYVRKSFEVITYLDPVLNGPTVAVVNRAWGHRRHCNHFVHPNLGSTHRDWASLVISNESFAFQLSAVCKHIYMAHFLKEKKSTHLEFSKMKTKYYGTDLQIYLLCLIPTVCFFSLSQMFCTTLSSWFTSYNFQSLLFIKEMYICLEFLRRETLFSTFSLHFSYNIYSLKNFSNFLRKARLLLLLVILRLFKN